MLVGATDRGEGFRERRRCPRRAFTLLELVLALALLMGMVAAAAFFVGPWLSGSGFEAQVRQFAAGLRFARAEAAFTGRTLRLTFEEMEASAELVGEMAEGERAYRVRLWQEARPLEEPWVFTPLRERPWAEQLEELNRAVVVRARLTGPDAEALRALAAEVEDMNADEPASVTFYPDGTSDSVQIMLAPVNGGRDTRRAVVRLEGLTGTVRHRIVDVADLDPDAEDEWLVEEDDDEVDDESARNDPRERLEREADNGPF